MSISTLEYAYMLQAHKQHESEKVIPLRQLQDNSARAASALKALAHQTRLLILCHIGGGQRSVQELESLLQTSQSNVSQHLAKLRSMEILTYEKIGNQVFYRVKNAAILEFVVQLQRTFCPNDDRSRP